MRRQLATYPLLIPLYGHRYLPARPHEAGNPVFSVMGSDIIHYGYDLFSYFSQEFTLRCPADSTPPEKPRYVEFWSDFDEPVSGMQWGYWEGPEDGEVEEQNKF